MIHAERLSLHHQEPDGIEFIEEIASTLTQRGDEQWAHDFKGLPDLPFDMNESEWGCEVLSALHQSCPDRPDPSSESSVFVGAPPAWLDERDCRIIVHALPEMLPRLLDAMPEGEGVEVGWENAIYLRFLAAAVLCSREESRDCAAEAMNTFGDDLFDEDSIYSTPLFFSFLYPLIESLIDDETAPAVISAYKALLDLRDEHDDEGIHLPDSVEHKLAAMVITAATHGNRNGYTEQALDFLSSLTTDAWTERKNSLPIAGFDAENALPLLESIFCRDESTWIHLPRMMEMGEKFDLALFHAINENDEKTMGLLLRVRKVLDDPQEHFIIPRGASNDTIKELLSCLLTNLNDGLPDEFLLQDALRLLAISGTEEKEMKGDS